MTHWLIELPLTPDTTSTNATDTPNQPVPEGADDLRSLVARELAAAGAEIVETQTSNDPRRLFVIAATHDTDGANGAETLGDALGRAGIVHEAPAAVRLVGASLDDVPADHTDSRWLVEWDLPEGLTMDTYLERKAANTPKYAEVPEVTFQRTWVREDMQKCLCFYDGPDEEAIRRARDVVGAPVDRLHSLGEDT